MKKKMYINWIAAFLAVGTLLTGCSQNETSSSESSAETTTATTVTTSEETEPVTEAPTEPEQKVIGVKAEGENIYHTALKNATGKEISGISIKDSSQENFPDNMMEKDDVFAKEEERTLYYDASEAIAANASEENDSDKALTPEYTVQLTFSDGTTAELHQFPFGDVETAEIHLEGELAYLVYTSVSAKTEVNTKEAEQMLAETNAETEPAVEAEPDNVIVDDANTNNGDIYEEQEPVYEAPEVSYDDTPAEAPVDNTPANNTPADPNDGCLGGEGLFN